MELTIFGIILVALNIIGFIGTHSYNKLVNKNNNDMNAVYKNLLKDSKEFELRSQELNFELNTVAFSLFYQAEFIKQRLIFLLENSPSYADPRDIMALQNNLNNLNSYMEQIKASFLSMEVKSPHIKYDAFQKMLGDFKFSNN